MIFTLIPLPFHFALLMFIVCSMLTAVRPVVAADLSVFILHSYHEEYPWTKKQNEGIVSTLQTYFTSRDISFSTEHLDTKRVEFTTDYQRFFKDYLQKKYRDLNPDIIFLTDDDAVRFMDRYQSEIFPDVASVFCGVNDTSLKISLPAEKTGGVFEVKDVVANLQLIDRLFPRVETVSVIGDNSTTYQAIDRHLRALSEEILPDLSLQFAADRRLSTVLAMLVEQGSEVVLLTTIGAFQNDEGITLPLARVIRDITASGSYAIFSMEDVYIQDGVFGGIVTSGVAQGTAAAQKGIALLTGVSKQLDQNQFETAPNVPTFNHHELDRFRIKMGDLPKNSVIVNKPLSFFEEFEEIFMFAFIAFLLLLTLIVQLSLSAVRRRKAESDLQASQTFLSSVLENLPDLVVVKDADELRYLRVNKMAERYFGKSKEEIVGKTDYDFFPEDEADFFVRKDKETLDTRIQVDIPLERIQTPAGRRYLHTKKIPILDSNRVPRYLLGISRDITEEISAAQKRKELEDKLLQAQKMESIGTLAGGIAHDFNNILSSVIGYSELAQYKADDPDEVRSLLDGTLKAAERAKLLVRQILTFSRKDEQMRKPIAVADLLEDSVSLLRATLPSTLTIKEDISCRGGIMADPIQIHQIIMNLGTNGYQAMTNATGTLSFGLNEVEYGETDDKPVAEMELGKYVRLSIEDNGVGMSRQTQERMFDPYFTTKDSTSGTGLGLAVVHGIVKSHEGHIVVSSEKGVGTKIYIYLPRIEGDVDNLDDSSYQNNVIGGQESILVVDDEPDITRMMEKYLTLFGYSVRVFADSPEALAEFSAHPDDYDLVITDMTMPEMTGIELTQKILAIDPHKPVILCTGHSDEIDRERATALGIRAYFEKPLAIDELLVTLRDLLDDN